MPSSFCENHCDAFCWAAHSVASQAARPAHTIYNPGEKDDMASMPQSPEVLKMVIDGARELLPICKDTIALRKAIREAETTGFLLSPIVPDEPNFGME